VDARCDAFSSTSQVVTRFITVDLFRRENFCSDVTRILHLLEEGRQRVYIFIDRDPDSFLSFLVVVELENSFC